MIRVLYVGDCSIRVELEVKGAEVIPSVDRFVNASNFLRDALAADPEIEVTHMCPQFAYADFPKTVEELNKYDVLIMSDVGYDTIILYPGEQKWKVPMGPNRVKEIRKYVEGGGGLLYCGGYFAFQGRYGRARWYGTPLADVLPVEILNVVDDRVESPEGVRPKILKPDHDLLKDIPWKECPPFMGYNKVGKTKEGAALLAVLEDDEEPTFMALWTYRKGRVFVFTSDPAPHWGGGFVKWEHYPKFWVRIIRWLAKQEK